MVLTNTSIDDHDSLHVDHTGLILTMTELQVQEFRRACPQSMKMQIQTENKSHDIEVRMPYISVKDGKDIQLSTDVLCMIMQNKYTDWEDLVSIFWFIVVG